MGLSRLELSKAEMGVGPDGHGELDCRRKHKREACPGSAYETVMSCGSVLCAAVKMTEHWHDLNFNFVRQNAHSRRQRSASSQNRIARKQRLAERESATDASLAMHRRPHKSLLSLAFSTASA